MNLAFLWLELKTCLSSLRGSTGTEPALQEGLDLLPLTSVTRYSLDQLWPIHPPTHPLTQPSTDLLGHQTPCLKHMRPRRAQRGRAGHSYKGGAAPGTGTALHLPRQLHSSFCSCLLFTEALSDRSLITAAPRPPLPQPGPLGPPLRTSAPWGRCCRRSEGWGHGAGGRGLF